MKKDDGDVIEVRCPVCDELVRMPEAEASEKMKARCTKGHEFPLAKALG